MTSSSDFFKQCTDDGTCYHRVNPIRIGSQSQDDILKQDLSFHCHITSMNQLEQADYADCKIGDKGTMLADHLNLQYENHVYACTSMNSRYQKRDHKYNCTRLVQKDMVVQDTVESPSPSQTQEVVPEISDEEFANFVPQTVLENKIQIQQNSEQIQKNYENIQSMKQANKKSPLPRFGFARMDS